MHTIKVMMNGLPGHVATVIGRHFGAHAGFRLLPFSLTGPEITVKECPIGGTAVELIRPAEREEKISSIKDAHGPFICIDFTHPSAVNANAEFYCRHDLPFVMGTTGGDRERLTAIVLQTGGTAVIAPNMAKQIVGFQAMMAYAAENFPDLFKGYTLTIRESHQSGKADTSGTAKAMVAYFNRMGIAFDAGRIEKERDPQRQRDVWGVPAAYLSGHAWHTYTLVSADQTARFEFTHNINGRDIYSEGTMDAVRFLSAKLSQGVRGKAYSMIDVIKEGMTA
ncbi:MAG: dihydrodipicolinate reductase [Desulfobacteraceae bacterium]|nr:MAG: dihydrodipicolinate reductase [Desulfobacteraceae bacterium]